MGFEEPHFPTVDEIRNRALEIFMLEHPEATTPEEYELREGSYWNRARSELMSGIRTQLEEYLRYLESEAKRTREELGEKLEVTPEEVRRLKDSVSEFRMKYRDSKKRLEEAEKEIEEAEKRIEELKKPPEVKPLTVKWFEKEYYAYGSRARPLEWVWLRGAVTSVPRESLVRLSRGTEYAREEPYFDILLSPKPLTPDEIKSIELTPLTKMPKPLPTAKPPEVPIKPPVVAPPLAPPLVPKPPIRLTADQIRLLRAKFNVALIDELGRVPPNSSSIFLVEFDVVKDKSYEEALAHMMEAAKEVVSREIARAKPLRPPPRERRIEPYRPPVEREEEFYVIPRVPPSSPPTEALNGPEERPFPRHPTSRENEALWKAFQYRLQEIGMNAFDYQDEWNEYIYGSNHQSWNHLLKRYEVFVDSIIKGKPLPPIWQWKGTPIPYGLEELLSTDPDQRVADLIIWAASTVISNARYQRRQPTVAEVIEKLDAMGIMGITFEDIGDSLMRGYKTLRGTNMKYDVWFTRISLEDLEELLATRAIRKPEEEEET